MTQEEYLKKEALIRRLEKLITHLKTTTFLEYEISEKRETEVRYILHVPDIKHTGVINLNLNIRYYIRENINT